MTWTGSGEDWRYHFLISKKSNPPCASSMQLRGFYRYKKIYKSPSTLAIDTRKVYKSPSTLTIDTRKLYKSPSTLTAASMSDSALKCRCALCPSSRSSGELTKGDRDPAHAAAVTFWRWWKSTRKRRAHLVTHENGKLQS